MSKKYGLRLMLTLSFSGIVHAIDSQQSPKSTSGASISQPIQGQDLIRKYKEIAAKNAKKGYGKSALYGAAEGAALGLIGATAVTGINTLPGTETALKQATAPDFGKQFVGPVLGVGFMGAVGWALKSMWDEAFARNSTPEWIKQLKLLEANKDLISNDVILYAGVPVDEMNSEFQKPLKKSQAPYSWLTGMTKRTGKAYLVSAQFNKIQDAHKDNHYELYLMPKDDFLVDLFVKLSSDEFFSSEEGKKVKSIISFMALRPTPGVTKSPFNGKNMPRIIIGFNSDAFKQEVERAVEYFHARITNYLLEKNISINQLGLGIQPRYSHKVNNLIYVAYGSADYKDSVQGKKEYADKVQTWWQWWQRWVSGISDEAMAYQNKSL